jgi:uncharacterized surface protein with fasciclin (FAS1) repeats
MTEGAQADNITGDQNGGMTENETCNITGIMTLTPVTMGEMAGNQTEDMTGVQTYDITGTFACMSDAIMTGETQAGNMTEPRAYYSITGNMTCMSEAMNNMTGVQAGNMTGLKTCYVNGTVSPSQGNDIIETARAAGNFKTLLAAIEAANLTDTLKGEGPYTVFAPTDKAFEALPEGTVDALLKDTDKLKRILLYHVADQRLMAKDVVSMNEITTLEGQKPPVKVADQEVSIGNAKIIMTDIPASNGVIHVIDTVLIPPEAEGQAEAGNMTEGTQAGNMTDGQEGGMAENQTENTT